MLNPFANFYKINNTKTDQTDQTNQTDPENPISKINKKIEDVKMVMHENIKLALDNCDKIENIEMKSEELLQQSAVFNKNAKQLKNKMWWSENKIKLLIGLIICILLTVFILIIYYTNKTTKS